MANFDLTPGLTKAQRAALAGLRDALGKGRGDIGAGPIVESRLETAAQNMVGNNELEAENELTMLETPTERRQHLAMSPNGRVYYPSESTMRSIGQELVYGGAPGGMGWGEIRPSGIASLRDANWAGFFGHFADKDRMWRQYAKRGLSVSGGPFER